MFADGNLRPKTRRQEAKASTRARVLYEARSCFETMGYEASTIRLIADRAGMSTGAIFANFAGKAEVYAAIYGHAPISPEAGRELREALIALRAAVAMNPSMQDGKFNGLRTQVNDALAKAA